MKNQVKELRMEKNITQQELATAVNVSRQTISYIENGEKSPNIIVALKIAEYFRMQVDEIFELESSDR
ncbi:hypothetical protein NEF87_000567 [Candidatus Lokiarchaeum ossiferum]|uniref:HTH cro/C1-type domain-containing protein n=1 Tax=Candidatus Lokiarchaeum ossiferum TaxID=2951803 RepID=A0ABY6HLA7_9ARCH|nr:hypothetical protein NEF87_000567 [Candidatus Lokiarchaeum sp. B-35]